MSDPRPDASKLKEAANWHARLGNRSITTGTLREFRQWRSDPDNDAAYQEIEQAWTKSAGLADDPDILRETEALLTEAGPRRAWRSRTTLAWGLALTGVALAIAASIRMSDPVYETGVGEQRLVRLADGSRIHINTNSRVRADIDGRTRRLVLIRGEAFFDVAHDAARPFVVEAGETRVRALGTRFDVSRDPDGLRVTLLEGSVSVARRNDRIWTLVPNQQLKVAGNGKGDVRSADAALSTSWTTGRLYFRSTPLAAAVAEVNRYAVRKIDLDPAVAADRPVSGVFDVGDTDGFVRAVAAVFDLSVTETPGADIRLSPDHAGG